MAEEKAAKFTTTTLKNRTSGPKVVNSRAGSHILQPGEEAEVELHENELAAIQRTNFLGDEGGNVPDGNVEGDIKELMDGKTVDQLREIADEEGVELADGDKKAEIARKIVDQRNSDNA